MRDKQKTNNEKSTQRNEIISLLYTMRNRNCRMISSCRRTCFFCLVWFDSDGLVVAVVFGWRWQWLWIWWSQHSRSDGWRGGYGSGVGFDYGGRDLCYRWRWWCSFHCVFQSDFGLRRNCFGYRCEEEYSVI
jgi:hypothetical protein